jgi:signal transduction histidine kinase
MTNMVNDLLLMSELQNDKMKIIKTECDLPDILTTIISRHKQKTMERGLNFKISFTPEEESFSIVADKEKLFIILSNLIVNSLKYSQENGIIEIRFEKTGTHHITLSIRNKIRDGITPELAALKNSFYHSKPANVEGIGLGLWIANRLSELNGFTMSVSIDGDWFEVSLRMLEVV